MTTSVSRARARVQQLCCLGLGGQAVMSALLEELHDLIPSYSNAFVWTDSSLKLSYVYDENPAFPEIVPVYVQEFYNARERELFPGFTESMRNEQGIQGLEDVLKIDKKSFYKHDFYDLIYRPMRYRQFIRTVVREGARPLGRLHLYRSEPREFTQRERQRLAEAAPFIAHALAAPADVTVPLVESPDRGLIIAEPSGRIQYLSTQAGRLLWMATNLDAAAAKAAGGRRDRVLAEGVRRLYRQLTGVFKDDEFAAPPVWQYRNAWGGFAFRAYWLHEGGLRGARLENGTLDPGAMAPTPLIAISVQRREPLPLKLMRQMEQLPLSGRQMQVCLLLAGGHSRADIALRLNVSRHTADYHCREIYARFDVHTRGELMGKLALL